jgi:hypothetical protein
MKAKLVLEKFTESGDPIKDMGIGVCQEKLYNINKKLTDLWDKYYSIVSRDDDDNDSTEKAWIAIDILEEIKQVIGYEETY